MDEVETHVIRVPSDLDGFTNIFGEVVGQPCTLVQYGYGEELFVELGELLHEEVLYKGTPITLHTGKWTLSAGFSDWAMYDDGRQIANSDESKEQNLSIVKQLEGRYVVSFAIDFITLQLTIPFSGNLHLKLTPPADDEWEDMPDWELYSTNKWVLRMGHGRVWRYVKA